MLRDTVRSIALIVFTPHACACTGVGQTRSETRFASTYDLFLVSSVHLGCQTDIFEKIFFASNTLLYTSIRRKTEGFSSNIANSYRNIIYMMPHEQINGLTLGYPNISQ